MRQKQTKAKPEKRRVAKEPLAEGIVPRKKNGDMDWAAMSDDELVRYAKRFIADKRIGRRVDLVKKGKCLYDALRARKLLDSIGLDKRGRDWSSMGDEEIVASVKRYVEDNGIRSKSELRKIDEPLYRALWKRSLLGEIGLKNLRPRYRNWDSTSDERIIEYVKRVISERGIRTRRELYDIDRGISHILRKRGLVDRIGLGSLNRPWTSMSDQELVSHAQGLVNEKGIKNRMGLIRGDYGLYQTLLRRKLLDRIVFEKRNRDWAGMGDEELVGLAKDFVSEHRIRHKKGLQRKDGGLYNALWLRGLLGRIGLGRASRDWDSMGDEEIIVRANRIIREKRIRNRKDMQKKDSGLYMALARRMLLDRIDLQAEMRNWQRISDEELLVYAQEQMRQRQITGRTELAKKDAGLYRILCIRKLLDEVFSGIERTKEAGDVRQVMQALGEFK